ncbi:MAG TPA: FtsX-like permease family protein [Gemmatimonadaceae bacterium]|nr:FtsX-like permease family protein [Gemmatimonadaceae bacterium]
MLLTLVRASFRRRRTRTLLAVTGVAVSAALLLDMVMLSSGMRASFRSMLLARGFELRLAPRGTLPFDTEATIDSMSAVVRTLQANPDIVAVSPVLGGQLHVLLGDARLSTVALGLVPAVEGDYELRAGRNPCASDAMVVSQPFLDATHLHVGDTVRVAAGYDTQMRALTGQHTMVITGIAHFLYMPADARVVAMPIASLQAMIPAPNPDRASLFMLRVRKGADVEQVRRWVERAVPRATAISTETAMQQLDDRLRYFRQLAFILGSVSLVVGFLLVSTLVTVSVNERLGEIAVMRAIGIASRTVILQVVLEGTAIMIVGSALGLALGLVTARYLNGILSSFPGLPAAIDFFLFQPRDAWIALGLLGVSGIAAGIYPAWRGASLPIATTLREEAVG